MFAQAAPGLRGAEGGAPGNAAVETLDSASTSETTGQGRVGAEIKSSRAIAAMAHDPSDDADEYTDGKGETPPPVLFANPIGEDFFVRGFDGNIYSWDDDWDDDVPSDEN